MEMNTRRASRELRSLSASQQSAPSQRDGDTTFDGASLMRESPNVSTKVVPERKIRRKARGIGVTFSEPEKPTPENRAEHKRAPALPRQRKARTKILVSTERAQMIARDVERIVHGAGTAREKQRAASGRRPHGIGFAPLTTTETLQNITEKRELMEPREKRVEEEEHPTHEIPAPGPAQDETYTERRQRSRRVPEQEYKAFAPSAETAEGEGEGEVASVQPSPTESDDIVPLVQVTAKERETGTSTNLMFSKKSDKESIAAEARPAEHPQMDWAGPPATIDDSMQTDEGVIGNISPTAERRIRNEEPTDAVDVDKELSGGSGERALRHIGTQTPIIVHVGTLFESVTTDSANQTSGQPSPVAHSPRMTRGHRPARVRRIATRQQSLSIRTDQIIIPVQSPPVVVYENRQHTVQPTAQPTVQTIEIPTASVSVRRTAEPPEETLDRIRTTLARTNHRLGQEYFRNVASPELDQEFPTPSLPPIPPVPVVKQRAPGEPHPRSATRVLGERFSTVLDEFKKLQSKIHGDKSILDRSSAFAPEFQQPPRRFELPVPDLSETQADHQEASTVEGDVSSPVEPAFVVSDLVETLDESIRESRDMQQQEEPLEDSLPMDIDLMRAAEEPIPEFAGPDLEDTSFGDGQRSKPLASTPTRSPQRAHLPEQQPEPRRRMRRREAQPLQWTAPIPVHPEERQLFEEVIKVQQNYIRSVATSGVRQFERIPLPKLSGPAVQTLLRGSKSPVYSHRSEEFDPRIMERAPQIAVREPVLSIPIN